jgi:hypothetical protein
MSSRELYEGIYLDAIGALRRGENKVDDRLDPARVDSRLGVSLIIPIPSLGSAYEGLVRSFSAVEPSQYYYPPEDLHATVFDYRSCGDDYARDAEFEVRAIAICDEVFSDWESLSLEFRGVVFSREAGLIKGYDEDGLLSIRVRIRGLLKRYGIENTERYESRSAHLTFCRFTSRLTNPGAFCQAAEKAKETWLGKENVQKAELVEHDWYNRGAKKRIIKEYTVPRSL